MVNLTSQTCAVYFSRTVFYMRHVFTVILGICESLSSAEAFYLRVLIQGQIHVRQRRYPLLRREIAGAFQTPRYTEDKLAVWLKLTNFQRAHLERD